MPLMLVCFSRFIVDLTFVLLKRDLSVWILCNHPKAPVLLNKKLASSSLASFFIIEGKHLLHLLLTSVVSQIV